MEAFDIGWIPGNWKRGDSISIKHCCGPGVIAVLSNDNDLDLITEYKTWRMADSLFVNVRAGESERCNAWLEWFRDPNKTP